MDKLHTTFVVGQTGHVYLVWQIIENSDYHQMSGLDGSGLYVTCDAYFTLEEANRSIAEYIPMLDGLGESYQSIYLFTL